MNKMEKFLNRRITVVQALTEAVAYLAAFATFTILMAVM